MQNQTLKGKATIDETLFNQRKAEYLSNPTQENLKSLKNFPFTVTWQTGKVSSFGKGN